MSNISKMFIRLNDYDVVVVNPVIKPAIGEWAVIRLTDGRFVLNRVTGNMLGAAVLGKPVEIRRSYLHGDPPYTMADVRDEKEFYNWLKAFEKVLYNGLKHAERRRCFKDYQRITDYFFKRLNRTYWDGKERLWKKREGVLCK